MSCFFIINSISSFVLVALIIAAVCSFSLKVVCLTSFLLFDFQAKSLMHSLDSWQLHVISLVIDSFTHIFLSKLYNKSASVYNTLFLSSRCLFLLLVNWLFSILHRFIWCYAVFTVIFKHLIDIFMFLFSLFNCSYDLHRRLLFEVFIWLFVVHFTSPK